MNNLTRWNPFRNVSRFDPMTNIEEIFRDFSLRPLVRDLEAATAEMRLDVHEDADAYRVVADIPGAKKEDIQVSAAGNQVTIEAEIKREEGREDARQLHAERYCGKTYRAFTLPREIDGGKCSASYDNGVLTLVLPKKTGGASTRIAVN